MAELIVTQDNRNIAVETPLGKDALLLQSLRLREGLNQPFDLTLQLQSPSLIENTHRLLGAPVTVTIRLPHEESRYLHGRILRFRVVAAKIDLITYEAEVGPWFSLLRLSTDCRIFHKMSVPEIVKQVLGEVGFSDYHMGLSEPYHPKGTVTQYRESHFDFVSRLLEQEGIAYYFKHTRHKDILVMCDHPNAFRPMPGYETLPYQPDQEQRPDIERVVEWAQEVNLESHGITVHDYDYTTPRLDLTATAQTPMMPGEMIGDLFEVPGYFERVPEGEQYARVRLEELNCRRKIYTGAARCAGLAAGATFQLTGSPFAHESNDYLVTEMKLHLVSADFTSGDLSYWDASECRVTAIEARKPFRPPRVTPRPVITEIQTAVVTAPEGYDPNVPFISPIGSVKVQFRWDRHGRNDDQSSGWVRVAQISAGSGWGSMFIPRAGNEVVVAFEFGDPDRPIVIGHLYNYVNRPPLALPEFAQRSYISDDGGNAISLSAEEGAQSIVFYSPTEDTMYTIGASEDPGAETPPPTI